jgi:hypothetical protein
MNKRRLFFGSLIILILMSFVLAQESSIPSAEEIQQGETYQEITKLQNISENLKEKAKWEYLGEEWQKTLLKNKTIAKFDEIFKKLNILFVILLAQEYSLSLTLLFALMIWAFTWISLNGYFQFIENEDHRILASLAATIALAHLKVFNYLAAVGVKLVLYRKEGWWTAISIILVIVAILFYYAINRIFKKMIKKGRERAKEKTRDFLNKKSEKFMEGISDGVK